MSDVTLNYLYMQTILPAKQAKQKKKINKKLLLQIIKPSIWLKAWHCKQENTNTASQNIVYTAGELSGDDFTFCCSSCTCSSSFFLFNTMFSFWLTRHSYCSCNRSSLLTRFFLWIFLEISSVFTAGFFLGLDGPG